MESILIEGGHPLRGEVKIAGAKNAALPIMAASLLTEEQLTVINCPELRDVQTMKNLLARFGVDIEPGEEMVFTARSLSGWMAPYELVKTMRASILVLGPLLARLGKARVSLPGGCAIGSRPIDLHLKGLAAMGADIHLHEGYVEVSGSLKGSRIYLDLPSVTGTENLMMAAVTAAGTTVLENAAREPEVINLAQTLKAMGARIEGEGTDLITIDGVKELSGGRVEVIPDRIEAGTLLMAGAITGGEVTILGCVPEHMTAAIDKLRESGFKIEAVDDRVTINGGQAPRPVSVMTLPYPGFPTDMQAQIMALMTIAPGRSLITETVFENRFLHVAELRRFGADITVQDRTAIIAGVNHLEGAPVMASDLRAGASLILAGLAANGETSISRIYHIDRGYQRLDAKLASLGAVIRRIP